MNAKIDHILKRTENYLEEKLLPFWASRITDPYYGGYQANLNREGERTDVTDKSMLCQARTLFSLSHASRMGFEWQGARPLLHQGIYFLENYFKDIENGGYYWMTRADGTVLDDHKVVYGHAFLIYAFSEYALLTGDRKAKDEACNLFEILNAKATDQLNGGYYQHFDRKFNLSVHKKDGCMKSLDVHMHLMEAFTSLYELTENPRHEFALKQITDLIFKKMLDPQTQLAYSMFTSDWEPASTLKLSTVWGSDRFDSNEEKPVEITSYGHNLELSWLYLHSLRVLKKDPKLGIEKVLPLVNHARDFGVDVDYGGIYVEGLMNGNATDLEKEFWQQAEALVGFLELYCLTNDQSYWDAFERVYHFVFEKMIHWDVGEWFPLLSREGKVKWDYMGHHWKISYHTVRSIVQVVLRLRKLVYK